MLSMHLDRVVSELVRSLHGDKNSVEAAGGKSEMPGSYYGDTKALCLSFDLRVAHYKTDRNASCGLHFLFNRPYGNYGFCTTHTFGAVLPSPFDRPDEKTKWDFLSSHDSCWKDAVSSYISQAECNLKRQVDPSDALKYSELSWCVWFPMFSYNERMYRWVDVRIEKDLTDTHNYEKLINMLAVEQKQ